MDSKKETVINNVKTAGSIAIYAGTASLIKPIVQESNKNKNAITKFCTVISGATLSCGISHIASKWFGTIVDKVAVFFDDGKGDANG